MELVMLSEREIKAIDIALGAVDKASAKLADALRASVQAHQAVDEPSRFFQWKGALYASFRERDASVKARLRQAVRRLTAELFPPAEQTPKAPRLVSLSRAYDALLAALAAAPASDAKTKASQALDTIASFLKLKE